LHLDLPGRLHLLVQLPVDLAVGLCHVEQRLDVLRREHPVLLPQVQDSDHLGLLLLAALVQVVEGHLCIFGKPRCKNILVRAKLMSGLSHYGIYHIEAWDFIFRLALLDELLQSQIG